MHRPPFPETVDSTMLKTFRSCPNKFYWEYLHHWKIARESVHLHAGKAFAKGLEDMRKAYWVDGHSPDDSLAIGIESLLREYGDFEAPFGSAKTADRMAGAMTFLADKYPLGSEGTEPISTRSGRAIEFSICLPLDFRHPTTGEAVLYTGRCDQIVHFAGGIFPEDDKTTSALGESWARQWEMRSQFTGYVWAARQAYENVQGVLVTGVSILKTKYDAMRVPTYRPSHMVDEWYAQVLRDLHRMKECWESGFWDKDLDDACSAYGGCIFQSPCRSLDPQPWLEANFVQRVWDPLAREERPFHPTSATN